MLSSVATWENAFFISSGQNSTLWRVLSKGRLTHLKPWKNHFVSFLGQVEMYTFGPKRGYQE